jgi:leucyl aminopeptidase
MKIQYTSSVKQCNSSTFLVVPAYLKDVRKGKKIESVVDISHWDSALKKSFKAVKISKTFSGKSGTRFLFNDANGRTILVLGMGEKKKMKDESIRKAVSNAFKSATDKKAENVCFDIGALEAQLDSSCLLKLTAETILLTGYKFENHKKVKVKNPVKVVNLYSKKKISDATSRKILKQQDKAHCSCR